MMGGTLNFHCTGDWYFCLLATISQKHEIAQKGDKLKSSTTYLLNQSLAVLSILANSQDDFPALLS
jgi:hypothetical protein